MAANTGTVKIRFDIDDQGSVKITQLGKKSKEAGGQVEESFRRGGRSLSDFNDRAAQSTIHIRRIALELAKMYAVIKTAQFVKDSALMAARYETLGIVMNTVGKTAGYTRDELDKQAKTLEKLGISMTSARESTIKSIQAGIGFNESLKLARIAQDAAVIGNINSSQAFEQMIYGIQTAQIEVLKTIGLNVNFEQSYARLSKELGKNTDQLTDQEKLQARLNAVFAEGSKIVGVYESAMSTAGKKLTSFSRYVDDFKVKMGEAFGPAVAKLVDDATIAMKRYTEEVTRPEAQKGLMDFALGLEKIASAAINLSEKMATLVQYANLRSVMGTVAEGMALVDKGVLDRETFIKASFVERQKMVDDYAQKVKNSSGVIRMAINEETEGYADYILQFNTVAEARRRAEEEKKAAAEKARQAALAAADAAKKAADEEKKRIKQEIELLETYDRKKIAAMPIIGDDYEGITEAIQSWPDTYREIEEEAAEAAEKTKKLADEAERAAKAFAELSGETFGEAFLSGLTDGFDGVWDSLRSKLTDIGADLIGKQIGDAISKPISQAITNTFKGMSKGLADSIGVAGSGVMGGLMAAGISTIVDSVFGGGENKYAAVYESQRKLAEEIRKNTEATRENTHFKRSGETSSYSSGFFSLRTAADEARQTLRDQMRDLKSPLGSVFDVDIGEMVDTASGLNAFIKSLDGMTIDTGGWADALAQFQGLADTLRATGKDVPVGVESIIATLEAFSADLDGVQKEIIASARDMWEGAGDAFRTEAEKQKREVERTGKDLLVGLAESFRLEGALPGGDYITSLSNMASVQEISGRILSDLIPGTEAYNQVMETTLLIYETARLQERKRAEETVAIYDGLNSYMKDLRGETTDLDRALMDVNNRFDDWEAQLKDAGATETDLSKERAEAIEITKKLSQETGVLTDEMAKQAEALEKSLADAVTRLSLSGKALDVYAINQEYQGYVDQIKALGDGYKDLVQKADEWRAISLSAIEEQIASGRAGVFSDMELYLKDLRGELSDVDKALIDVNSRFDGYEETLKELTGEEVSLSAEREEAIRLTRKLHEESAALADSLVDLSSAMSSVKGMWSSAMDPYMPDRDREVKAFERAGKEALQSLATAYGMVNINWSQSVETLAGTVLSLSQGTAAFDAALEMTSLLRQTAAAQERKQAETTADLYSDLDLYLRGLRGGLTDVDRAVMEVNKRFDDYEAQILNATGAEVSLATERAEAIALTKKLSQETGALTDEMAAQAKAMEERLTDSILRIALPDDLFNRYRIDQEYQEYIDQIKELGSGYSSLITKAKEWRKLSLDTLTKQAQAEEARNKAAEYQNQADAWGSSVDSVSSFLNDLKYGESSTLSTAEKMAEIQKELKSIRPSTTEDISRAQELWKTYLSLGKERFQLPSSEWRAIMADATAELYDLREYAADKETELLNLTREQNQILMNVEQWTKALATRTAAAYDLPGYATGLDYVPNTMPVIVHPREAILNATDAETWRRGQTEKGGDVITVNFTVNGAARPEDTARLARMEIESYLNGRGRRRLQAAAMGR